MTKRVVLAVLGLLYTATAVLVVHSLGESYRQSLRERRALMAIARARNATVADRPDESPPSVARPEPDSSTRGPARPNGHTTKAKVAPPSPAGPVVADVRPISLPKPYESPVKLRPLVLAGLDQASTAEEAIFGETLDTLIRINHPAVEDGSPQQRTVLEAAQPMIDLRSRKDVEVKIVVLDTDGVNAFSHLGGYIDITRGLLSFAGTDEEFRFVVGHELAHIDLKHGQEQVASLTRDGTVAKLGTLQAMYHQVAVGYTEAQEFAADDLAIDRMVVLGHTPRECLMYLRKLRRLSEDLKFREGHQAPKTPPDATVQDVGNHIRSEPAAWRRLARLETRLDVSPARASAAGPGATSGR